MGSTRTPTPAIDNQTSTQSSTTTTTTNFKTQSEGLSFWWIAGVLILLAIGVYLYTQYNKK